MRCPRNLLQPAIGSSSQSQPKYWLLSFAIIAIFSLSESLAIRIACFV
jgi:hypothetical protein